MHKITYLCPPGNQGDVTSFLENICLGERDGVGLHRNLLHWESTNLTIMLAYKHQWITNMIIHDTLTRSDENTEKLTGLLTLTEDRKLFHNILTLFKFLFMLYPEPWRQSNVWPNVFFCARFQSRTCYPWQQPIVGISTKNINQNLVQKGPPILQPAQLGSLWTWARASICFE